MLALESTDIAQAIQYFDKTRRRVIDVTASLSDAQWQFKPAPDRWSTAEILEHMTIVHGVVLARLQRELSAAPAPSRDSDARILDALITEKIPDRSIKAKAPDFIQPTGTVAPVDAVDRLFRAYEHLTAFLESTPELRDHVLESPPLKVVTKGQYSLSDGYQWALTLAAHDERHARQIQEVKKDPNFPA